MYGWDSYFIILGLEADHREALAKGIVDNFLFEIEHYGGVLNANRTYYLTRSQPPFLTSMIRAVFEDPASFPATPAGRTQARTWLEHAYALAQKDHSTWKRPEHKAGSTGLARYFDYGTGPVPEMADDSTYYADVIRWLVAHPHKGGEGYLVKGSEHPDAAEAARLKATSCDVQASVVCMRAWSGATVSAASSTKATALCASRVSTPSIASVRSLAPRTLRASLPEQPALPLRARPGTPGTLLGNAAGCGALGPTRQQRTAAIQRYLWRPKDGVFADFDFVHARTSSYAYITSLYPLWAGFATREQATTMETNLNLFERPGGLLDEQHQHWPAVG